MNVELMSARLLQFGCLIFVIWNIIAVLNDASGTLSKVILRNSIEYASIPIILGFLLGHMMCPLNIINEHAYWMFTLPLAIIMLVTVVVGDFTFGWPKLQHPIIYLLLAMPFGAILWPQKLVS